MPSIQGEYTFTELCLKLGVSAPWVKKVQRLFRLPEAHGTKGVRTYYTERQIQFLRNIRTLRAADVDFKELLVLDGLERWLLEHGRAGQHSRVDEAVYTLPLLLRNWESVRYRAPERTAEFPGKLVFEVVSGKQRQTVQGLVLDATGERMAEYYRIAGHLQERLSRRVQELAEAEEEVRRTKKKWTEWLGNGVEYGEGT